MEIEKNEKKGWTMDHIPQQTGRTAVVKGLKASSFCGTVFAIFLLNPKEQLWPETE